MTVPARTTLSRRSALACVGATGLGVALGVNGDASAQDGPSPAVETVRGLAYGEDAIYQVMDVARPEDRSTPVPAVVLLHGGGFVFGSRSEMNGFGYELARADYAAYSVEYRLFNRSTGANAWPTALDDVQRAVRWLGANAAEQGIDPDRIAALGISTGGHLAAFLGTRGTRDDGDPELAGFPSKVACVVDVAGESDFTIPYENPDDTTLYAALVGGTADRPPSDEAYRDLSPVSFVDGSSAPFLLVHGGSDAYVPVEHSRRLEAALHEASVDVTYAEFAGLGHEEVFSWSLVGTLVLAFLGRHLAPDSE